MILEYNIENEERILIQGKGNYCSKLKKRKLKTKKLLKITILDEQEPSVQSADRTKAVQVWSWGNMYLPKPGKLSSSQHLYNIWKQIVGSMLERIPSNNIWK